MADARTPRELETREKKRRWQPASLLPTPKDEPGFRFRWVMTHLMGEAQPTNVSQRLREGFEPVKAVNHPELGYEADKNGNVVVGGLMLCKIPEEMAADRQAYYEEQANNQMAAVKRTYLGQSDPRMPVFAEVNSKATRGGDFGNGK